MKINHLTPDTLFDSRPYAFTQVVVSESKRMIHCAGQTACDKNMKFIGLGDLAAQAEYALSNLGLALAAAGAGPGNVVQLRVYVVQYKPDYLPIIGTALGKFFAPHPCPANTLIGVQSLALPEFMIEIEATAVID
jgi:enamine deaminase RidA (YjgF/YER057c/UK114 family)